MNNTINSRIKKIRIEFCNNSNIEFAKRLNKNANVTSNWVRDGYSVGRGVASDIANEFPVNIDWILTGEGEMIKDNINENQIDLNISDMKDFIKTIREEQKMLAEALSQNSRLIGIIERMQGISESNVSSTPPHEYIQKNAL